MNTKRRSWSKQLDARAPRAVGVPAAWRCPPALARPVGPWTPASGWLSRAGGARPR